MSAIREEFNYRRFIGRTVFYGLNVAMGPTSSIRLWNKGVIIDVDCEKQSVTIETYNPFAEDLRITKVLSWKDVDIIDYIGLGT